MQTANRETRTHTLELKWEGGMSENYCLQSWGCRPSSQGQPAEQSFADIVWAGDRPQSLWTVAGCADRHETHVTHELVETPAWSPRSGDDVS